MVRVAVVITGLRGFPVRFSLLIGNTLLLRIGIYTNLTGSLRGQVGIV